MEIKIFGHGEIETNLDHLAGVLELFGYGDRGTTVKILDGTRIVAVAYEGTEIVGFGRIIGDGIRFSHIVDLNINERYRRKGAGTKLVQALAKQCNTHHIDLTNDPKYPWLKDFYIKAGFKLSEGEHVFSWSLDNDKA